MISIITAVHNQLEMNKIFLENLRKYTVNPFELIIIDNNSTDGTREFFEQEGAVVIANKANYSYPYTQNQGIKVAKYNLFAFLNNDIIVCPQWDQKIIESMQVNGLDLITVCGIERVETPELTKKLGRKWKRIKNILKQFGLSKFNLTLMHKLMYGNWEDFNNKRQQQFKNKVVEGFVGNSVIFNRTALNKIGLWDERIQGADFDIYMRSKKRNLEFGDMKPCHIALNVFNHHYIRITAKSKPPVFADAANMIALEDKWSETERKLLLMDNVTT